MQLEIKDPRGFAEYLRQFEEHSPVGAANTLLGVQNRRPSFYDLTAEMARMDVPTLIMSGDEEEPCLEVNLLMKRVIPTAALAILPRSGHAINLEEPALFNRLLEDFFRQVEAGRWGAARCALDRAVDLRPVRETMTLRVEKRGAVGWIVFDQPARRNAINGAMWRGIAPAMAQLRCRPRGALRRVPRRGHRGVLRRRGYFGI